MHLAETATAVYSALESSASDVSIFGRQTFKNQIYLFTKEQAWVQRVLAISASTISIVFCLVAFYVFLAIDPKRLVFRHQLIAFLLCFDLLKAVVLLIYPTIALSYNHSYYDKHFCQVVGYFTAVAIEGADFAILAFAIHTLLLIFKPSLSIRVGKSGFTEGGLYKYRFYVYGLSFLIPVVMASLAYINGAGYDSLICWCYLPRSPMWYRFVLSWVPRYIIVIIIIAVYCAIYFHIIREFKIVGGMFTTMHRQKLQRRSNSFQSIKPSLWSALKYFFKDMKDRIVPRLVLPESKKPISSTTTRSEYASNCLDDKDDNNNNNENNSDGDKPFYGVDIEDVIDDPEIQAQNLENFKERQKLVAKQMKSIFIYPFAYCFVWLFPFILHITQVKYELTHHPIYWLNCVSAFMQPFNGFVDTLVFFYRERPLSYTILKNFERENALRLSELSHPDSVHDASSLTTSTRFTKQSISASLGVDIYSYSKWRRVLNWIGLPLFKLPTDENLATFRANLENGEPVHSNDISLAPLPTQYQHDFSNILNVDYPETEFRSELGNYVLNFNKSKTSRNSANSHRASLTSNLSVLNATGKRTHSNASSIRSPRSGRASFGDLSIKSRNSSLSDLSQKHNVYLHFSAGPNMNKLVSYQQQKSRRATAMAPSAHAYAKQLNKRNMSRNTPNVKNLTDSDEVDFLEFLRRGP